MRFSGPNTTPARAARALAALWLATAGCSPGFHGRPVEPPRAAPEIAAEIPGRAPFRLSGLRGGVALVTFGYTHCPDICPLTLSTVKGLYRRLGADGDRVATVFVTVDPERDSPEQLARYVAAFDPRVVPVWLPRERLREVLSAYGATARRRESDPYRSASPSGARYYAVDHTSGFFVVDARGQLRLRSPHDATSEQLYQDLRRLLAKESD